MHVKRRQLDPGGEPRYTTMSSATWQQALTTPSAMRCNVMSMPV
jgi:hypothetical protein